MQVIRKIGLACLGWLGATTIASANEGYMFCSASPMYNRGPPSSQFVREDLTSERMAACLQGSRDRLKERACRIEVEKSVHEDMDRRETVFFTDHFVAEQSDFDDIERDYQSYVKANFPDYRASCEWSSTLIESEAERGREIRRARGQRRRNIDIVGVPFAVRNSRSADEDESRGFTGDFLTSEWRPVSYGRVLVADPGGRGRGSSHLIAAFYRESTDLNPKTGYREKSGGIEWKCQNNTAFTTVTCVIHSQRDPHNIHYYCASSPKTRRTISAINLSVAPLSAEIHPVEVLCPANGKSNNRLHRFEDVVVSANSVKDDFIIDEYNRAEILQKEKEKLNEERDRLKSLLSRKNQNSSLNKYDKNDIQDRIKEIENELIYIEKELRNMGKL
ncbi:hypothetical protein [Asticcacaulis sp. W401b]|uniref:hypothetical protein n=1 Tax=Asticcacaulis sp. W401b TaxID=3388666 RepID=UPI003970C975